MGENMANVLQIRDFGELAQYLAKHHEQSRLLSALLCQSSGLAMAEAASQEQFVRLLYRLDSDMAIAAEALRFAALALYPYRARLEQLAQEIGKLNANMGADEEWGGAEAVKEPSTAVATLLQQFCQKSGEAAMEETVLTLQCTAQVETPEEAADNGQVAAEIDYLEQSWVNIELTDAERKTLAGEVAAVSEEAEDELAEAPVTARPAAEQKELTPQQQLLAFLRRRRYFWPELRGTSVWVARHTWRATRWTGRYARQGYHWLAVRHFFWPQLWFAICWSAWHVANRVRWLRDRQEIYVWLRPYQGNSGYYLLFARKPCKINLHSQQAKLLARVYEFAPKETVRVVQGILKSELNRADRDAISQLKDYILIHEKLLTQKETVRDILNYGIKKFRRTIHQLSHVTNLARLNRHMEGYFFTVTEAELLELPKEFRHGLESCYTFSDLKKFMAVYPLYRASVAEHYKPLLVVAQVQRIIADFVKTPNQLIRILNRHIGAYGDVNLRNQLTRLLLTSQTNDEIWDVVKNERYLDGLLASFHKLERKKRCQYAARSMRELVTTFMAGEGKFTFSDFKAGLNFVPEKLQHKVTALVRHELQEKLNGEVASLLTQQGKYAQRLDKFRHYLADPRYAGSGIPLFGYELPSLEQKIAASDYRETGMEESLRHVFGNNKVPDLFLQFLGKAKKAEASAKEKSVANCLRMLDKIVEAVARREQVQLYKALIALFQLHGSVNFAAMQTHSFSGYQIAEELNRFYRNPRRTTLQLSETIVAEVRNVVKKLVDSERQKQLTALKREQA
jgi:hypothetical protein